MDDSSETMDHNNASFASMEPVAANKKEFLPRTAVSNIKSGRLHVYANPKNSITLYLDAHLLIALYSNKTQTKNERVSQ